MSCYALSPNRSRWWRQTTARSMPTRTSTLCERSIATSNRARSSGSVSNSLHKEHTVPPVLVRFTKPVIGILEFLTPVVDLGIRLWIAKFFWDSGLSKIYADGAFPFIHVNQTTITLFQTEYHVPVISPVVAAYLGTTVELIFPVMLAFGFGGRLAAAVLF